MHALTLLSLERWTFSHQKALFLMAPSSRSSMSLSCDIVLDVRRKGEPHVSPVPDRATYSFLVLHRNSINAVSDVVHVARIVPYLADSVGYGKVHSQPETFNVLHTVRWFHTAEGEY